MAFFSVIFAVIFGLVFGVGKMSDRSWISWPSWAIVEFFRAVPLLLLIIFIFFTFGTGGGIGSFWSVVVGLTLYNGAVLAEVFRAGVNAVPHGQAEAAYAIGMRKSQVMNIVLLPQAIKIMLPAIISQMVVALKDTSLGFYILAPGLTAVGKLIYTESQPLPTAIVVTSAVAPTVLSPSPPVSAGWSAREAAGGAGDGIWSGSPPRLTFRVRPWPASR
jgi:glutamate transport system permease protein